MAKLKYYDYFWHNCFFIFKSVIFMVTYFLRLICIFVVSLNLYWLEDVLLHFVFSLTFLNWLLMPDIFFFYFFFSLSVILIFFKDSFFLLKDFTLFSNRLSFSTRVNKFSSFFFDFYLVGLNFFKVISASTLSNLCPGMKIDPCD